MKSLLVDLFARWRNAMWLRRHPWCGPATRYVNKASAGGDGTTEALTGPHDAYASINHALAEYPTLDAPLDIVLPNTPPKSLHWTHIPEGDVTPRVRAPRGPGRLP